MDDLIIKRDTLKQDLILQQKKIFDIENEIMDIEKQLANFSDNLILENLKLSKQQQEIVDAEEDNILVVACPGSGKTHTLISRYIKLILDNKTTANETLLITFTKKAGMEMLNRLSKILPHKIPYHVGSLHGLSYKVLQDFNDINYTVLDEKDVKDYLKNIIMDNNVVSNLDEEDINIVKSKIQLIIDQASTYYPFDMKPALKKNNLDKYSKYFNLVYKIYQQKKKKENIIDFNDLMVMFCKFLDDDKSNSFKDQIKYVFFDEYQDVNPIQNYILMKFAIKSKIMVVGDDAQAIYAFRGSSVKYILDFNNNFDNDNKSKKMYLLEENYRSTPSIVHFCQDIIGHNINQFEKKVISKQDKIGLKPSIYCFNNKVDEYKWIVDDIIKRNKEGVKFSDMVILARKNTLLDDIERHLINKKIPVVKHLGLSLLDKPHIKDFIAFIILLTNPKSSIHWKRVLSLHPKYTMKKINTIIDSGNNILESLKNHVEKEKVENPTDCLIEFYGKIIQLRRIRKDIDKAKCAVVYLEKLWVARKDSDIDSKVTDIYKLLNFLKNSSLEQFITDLYLNQEVETNMDNVLFLTTTHSAKGLEWEHVYIIDVNSKDFPSIWSKYYLDELEDTEEERRLFYVAASRAKKYLTITYHESLKTDNQIMISPLLREVNNELYNGCNVKINKIEPTLIISKDVINYLRFIGYEKVNKYLSSLENNRSNINKPFDFPSYAETLSDKHIIGNFMDYLISKIIQINFIDKVKKFDLNVIHKETNFPQKIYSEYIDPQIDWRNSLENIFYISTFKINSDDHLETYKKLLINSQAYNYYIELEKGIVKLINSLKPKEIYTHYVVSQGTVKAEIDILCGDTIIEIKSSINNEIATVSNISQTLMYAYMMKKKECAINQILLYNPLNGELNRFDVSGVNFIEFKRMVYN